MKSIGRAGKAKGGEGSTVDGMPPFLRAKNLIPFITSDLIRSTEPIIYETRRGNKAFGYRATLLPSVCWVYHDAQLAGKTISLNVNQCTLRTIQLPSLTPIPAQCLALTRKLRYHLRFETTA